MCIFFQVEPPVAVAGGVWGIAAIDIGADGISDFVVADKATNQVTLLASNGFGGFSSETTFAVGAGPEGIAVADVNGDGEPDVVTANATGNSVSVLLNNGSGGFKPALKIAVGKDPTSVITASINGEKYADIIVADSGGNQVTVLTSNGKATPTFTAATYAVGADPNSVVAADLVPGGRPDLITSDGGAGEISVLINNGHGGFSAAANYAVGGGINSDPMAVTTADLTDNNLQDVIVANGNGTVSVLLNTGNGTLAAAQNFQFGTDLTAITTAVLDSTGTPDILVADSASDSIYVLSYQNGALFDLYNLQFAAAVVSMSVADVNDDGRPDIVATLANGDVQVVLNQSDYSAAQAIAAYAANPMLTGMPVLDTGADLGANLDGLEKLAQAGALGSVTDSDYAPISLTSPQLFNDYLVLNDLGYVQLTLSSGPLTTTGFLQSAYGAIDIFGPLTNTGSLNVTAENGSLTLVSYPLYPVGYQGEFVNAGSLTVGNGYQLILSTPFSNTGSLVVSGGALLDVEVGQWSNTGAISINDATMQISASLGLGSLGSITDTGGVVYLTGELFGPGVLNVGSGTGLGTMMMEGTIANATIVDHGGGMEFFGPALNPGDGVLQNVTYEGALNLGLHDDEVTATGGLTLLGAGGTGPGTIQLTGSAARLNLYGIGTLNNATVYIGSAFKSDQSVLYAEGRALTLGSNLSIVQVQAGALLEGDRGIGDGIINDGSITAAIAGGELVVRGGDFTNNGSLLVGNGEAAYLDTTQVGNISAGTLSGGTWAVDGASTLWLPADSDITKLAANLTLTGSGSAVPTVAWFSSAVEADVTLQQSLATIAAGGLLTLSGAWTFLSTNASGLDLLGAVALSGASLSSTGLLVGPGGSLSGNGSVIGPVTDNGTIAASGGLLDLSGAVKGDGTLSVGSGATIELAASSIASATVKFAAATGVLWMLSPSATTISGFVQGDTIDLGKFIETSDTYNTTTRVLTIDGSGGASVALTFVGTYTQSSFLFATDNNGGTDLTDPPGKIKAALAAVAKSPELVGAGGVLPGGEAIAATTLAASPDPLGGGAVTPDGVQVVSTPTIWTPGHG